MKPLPCFCLFVWLCLPLHAKDLAAYRAGDIADADITTPVALDVVDAAATAALQSARATQYPAVFRSLPAATNALTCDFLATFTQARTNFIAGLVGEFHAPKVAEVIIASADFGRLVTAFGVEHQNFPVTDELASEWARGGEGQAIQEKLLAALLRAANRRVRPDTLPKCMVIGETIRLVPVTDENAKLSFETVQQGQLVPTASLATISEAQALFRRDFPAGQQLFARTLAAWLKPNCLPDAPFTQLTRGTAVCQLIVSDHFDAGDAIVRRGDTIDAKLQAALALLNEKLKSNPPSTINPQVLVTIPNTQSQPPPRSAGLRPASAPTANALPSPRSIPPPPQKISSITIPAAQNPASIAQKPAFAINPQQHHNLLIVTLAGTSLLAVLAAFWGWLKLKPQTSTLAPQTVVSTAQVPLQFLDASKPDLTPQVTQVMREAVQQELTSQRRELLLAQQAATGEIAALVQRLDELQVPMQERLRAYETHIHTLEKELALRNEENRQLLTMKIEMINRQLATERTATLVPPMVVS